MFRQGGFASSGIRILPSVPGVLSRVYDGIAGGRDCRCPGFRSILSLVWGDAEARQGAGKRKAKLGNVRTILRLARFDLNILDSTWPDLWY